MSSIKIQTGLGRIAVVLFFCNLFVIESPKFINSFSLIYSNPLFLRVTSPTANSAVADKVWFLTKYIDEIYQSDRVDEVELFEVYRNLTIIDPAFEIGVIYASTYLVSIAERGDLAIKLLKTAQQLDSSNFQYLFTELVFQIAYLHNSNIRYLENLAKRCAEVGTDRVVSNLRVDTWIDEILKYLHKKEVQQKILENDRKWLGNIR
ncbi:MAG TPA: hypothetical protein EYO61_06230 [Campylobacterales bacterium]|nr:hypothetical protein [Campylobacterales bacterium]